MEYLKISEKQRETLIELCKIFFPDHEEIYWNSGKGNRGSDEHIGFSREGGTVPQYLDFDYIHWFQICMIELPKKILAKKYRLSLEAGADTDKGDFEMEVEQMYRCLLFPQLDLGQPSHPVDYLYSLAKNK